LDLGRKDRHHRKRSLDDLLSNRESDVLRHLARGGSNRDLAEALEISEGTVKRHLANIYAKLGATSRIDAVRKAAERGMIGISLAG
jgi:DNA-binding NarL/FixJ family response regulator